MNEEQYKERILQLATRKDADDDFLGRLITCRDEWVTSFLYETAAGVRQKWYGRDVYIRGLIEISNFCRNDCYYCGIRRSNDAVSRYRLTEGQILDCCRQGYDLGFRTFVLQGGGETLENFLARHVFADAVRTTLQPDPADVEGFRTFLNHYKTCLRVEQAATENL